MLQLYYSCMFQSTAYQMNTFRSLYLTGKAYEQVHVSAYCTRQTVLVKLLHTCLSVKWWIYRFHFHMQMLSFCFCKPYQILKVIQSSIFSLYCFTDIWLSLHSLIASGQTNEWKDSKKRVHQQNWVLEHWYMFKVWACLCRRQTYTHTHTLIIRVSSGLCGSCGWHRLNLIDTGTD